jgi:hypothetical protein
LLRPTRRESASALSRKFPAQLVSRISFAGGIRARAAEKTVVSYPRNHSIELVGRVNSAAEKSAFFRLCTPLIPTAASIPPRKTRARPAKKSSPLRSRKDAAEPPNRTDFAAEKLRSTRQEIAGARRPNRMIPPLGRTDSVASRDAAKLTAHPM